MLFLILGSNLSLCLWFSAQMMWEAAGTSCCQARFSSRSPCFFQEAGKIPNRSQCYWKVWSSWNIKTVVFLPFSFHTFTVERENVKSGYSRPLYLVHYNLFISSVEFNHDSFSFFTLQNCLNLIILSPQRIVRNLQS